MTRASTNHPYLPPTTATQYVANAKPVSDMLKSVLTQTTDTGQVNWANVTTLPGNGAVRDYEVYRLTDSLQSSAPIFVRIDYMLNSSASPNFNRYDWSVGTSTDGAGNLGGVTIARGASTQTLTNAATQSSTQTSYVSTDGSQIVIVLNLQPSATAVDNWFGLVVERFRGMDGTPLPDGYNAWGFSNMSAQLTTVVGYARVIAQGATQTGNEYSPPVLIPQAINSASASTFQGNTDYAWPFWTNGGAILRGPSNAILYGLQVDWPRDAEVSIPYLGSTKKFLALGTSANMSVAVLAGQSATAGTSAKLSPLFRWE